MPVWDPKSARPQTQKEWAYKSRTYVAQVVAVDPSVGTMDVILVGLRERYKVDTPTHGFSVQGVASSWSRYMPVENEYVHVAFDSANRPCFVGMATYLFESDSGMYAKAAGYLGTTFRTLGKGEYDLRSSGGAGYYFDRFGHATLEAGVTTIELDRDRMESVGNSGLWVRGGFGTEVRWGDVKRLTTGTAPSAVLPSPATSVAAKEWRRTLGTNPLPGVNFYLEVEEVGDVRDDLGAVVVGTAGQALRYRRRMYDATGTTPVYTAEVDVLGNVRVALGATAAVGVEVIGTSSPFRGTFRSVEVEAVVGSASVRAAGEVQLAGGGGTASDGVVLGSALSTWLQSQLSVLTAFGPSGPAIAPLVPGVQYSNTVKGSV